MPAFKGINTESDPSLHFSNVCVQLRRHTLTASHLVEDDIDTCTMKEARNLNFCWTNGSGQIVKSEQGERFLTSLPLSPPSIFLFPYPLLPLPLPFPFPPSP